MTIKMHFETICTPFRTTSFILSEVFLECRNFSYALTHQTENYIGSHLHGMGGA